MLCLNSSDIVIMTGKGVDNRYIIHDISKFEAIPLLENSENSWYIKNAYPRNQYLKVNSRVRWPDSF